MAFVTVQGTVTKLFTKGGGFAVRESWQSKQGERHRRWAVFPKEPTIVAEGQAVKVSGGLGAKIADRTFTGQDGAEHSYIDFAVNSARVDVSDTPQNAPASAQQASAAQSPSPWGVESSTGGWDVQEPSPF